jgi:hypothetical protein
MVHLTSSLSCAWNFFKLSKIEVIMLTMISPHCSSHGSSSTWNLIKLIEYCVKPYALVLGEVTFLLKNIVVGQICNWLLHSY